MATKMFNGLSMRTSNFLVRNGVELPTPSTMKVDYYDLVTDAERSLDGYNHANVVRMNVRKVMVSWNYLSQDELQLLLQRPTSFYYPITYFDPLDGDFRTITVYNGDRSTEMLSFDFTDYVGDYTGFSLSFIEQ